MAAGSLDPVDAPLFPESLADVAGPRVVETFDLGPPLLALALLAADAYFVAGPRRAALDAAEYAVLALLLAGALGLVRHEVLRRRRRAVLVAGRCCRGPRWVAWA